MEVSVEIHELCLRYKKHLGETTYLEEHGYQDIPWREKSKIINSLLYGTDPERILFLLSNPKGPLYKNTLQKHRSDWKWIAASIFLVLVTFPISLPILISWSLFMRGTFNFLKSEGAILAEKLIKLSEKSLSGKKNEEIIHLFNLTIPFPVTSLLRTTPMVYDLSSTSKTESNTTGLPSSDLDLKKTAPKSTHKVPNLYASQFYPEKDAFKDTGQPRVIASRIRSFNPKTDTHFFIDAYVDFKYSNQKPQLLTLTLLTNLPVLLSRSVENYTSPSEKELPNEENLVTRIHQKINNFFFVTPTFEHKYNQADKTEGYNKRINLFEEALALARNLIYPHENGDRVLM